MSTLILIYFGRPQLGHKIKTNFTTFQTVDPEISSILIIYKRVGNSFNITFYVWLFKKNIVVVFFSLSKFHYLFAFISWQWAIMCIVIICWPVHDAINFQIKLSFLIKLLSYITKESGQKQKYLNNEMSF